MAFLVALEGIDGSGKGTQARRLTERFAADGFQAALISFPRYEDTIWGKVIGDFLDGRYGPLGAVDPFLLALLYAGDRLESRQFLFDALADNDAVVLDRYVASNVAHQGAKREGTERAELIRRIEQHEYEFNQLPRADLTVLLDLPAEQAQLLIAKKSQRSYTSKAADENEADLGYLQRVRQVYLDLAKGGSWHTVDCLAGNQVRAIDDIAQEIWTTVYQHPRFSRE